jgi:hypothetical protein
LERTDKKNQFSKIKKNIVLPPPRSALRIRRREEAALGLVVAKVGKEGVGGRRSASVTPTFYKNKFFVQIGVHIKMHIKL